MDFAPTAEQRGFARSLDDLLSGADVPTVARAWAGGEHDSGLKLWRRLADLGVTGLLVPEDAGGLGATPVEAVVAWESLGRHAVAGPWVETAVVTRLLAEGLGTDGLLAAVAEGSAVATLATPPWTPYALDADVATHVLHLEGRSLRTAEAAGAVASVDPVRRLHRVAAGEELASVPAPAVAAALDTGALLCAAQLLGLGEALLDRSVGYVTQRRQFGRVIGEYQALKHALADVRIALDFARPLVWGAAVASASAGRCDDGTGAVSRAVSGAKVAAGDAAYRAARTGLQVHGAIGYTAEHDLSLWLLRVRALVNAWGSGRVHRARILASLVDRAETAEGRRCASG